MPTLEIKSLTVLKSNIEEAKGKKELNYEILAKDYHLLGVASNKILEDIKHLISNHPELDGLDVTTIHVYPPNDLKSTDLSKQILDLTLSGRADVYYAVYETEDG